jgi:HK97 family phage major capsid protein
MSTRLFDLRKKREDFVSKADLIVTKSEAEKRQLTEDELKTVNASLLAAQNLAPEIKELESQNTLAAQYKGKIPIFDGKSPRDTKENGGPASIGGFSFPGVANFMETREGGIRASLTEGSDLEFVVPGYQVLQFKTAYPSLDPFRQAGASIMDLDAGWIDAKIPIVVAGTEPSTYGEGSGPTNDESAKVYVADLSNPTKLAALSKPTEEALADIASLANVVTAEGLRRVANKGIKTDTLALLSSLTAAASIVSSEGDNYADMLNMIGAIPTYFAGPSNCWMGSRRTKALLRNTRAGADNLPVFNGTATNLLGYDFITNDYIPAGQLLFGDFSDGVFLRRSALIFQVLNEAYREAGKVGFRFYQRADRAFFSDAATAAQTEQPLVLLTSDLGS